MASASEVPLWETTNKQYAMLQDVVGQQYESVKRWMYDESVEYTKDMALGKRIIRLNKSELIFSEFRIKADNIMRRFKENVGTLLIALEHGGLQQDTLRKALYAQIFSDFIQPALNKSPITSYAPIEKFITKMDHVILYIGFVKLLTSYKVDELGPIVFQQLHGKSLKDISSLPKWPYVSNVQLSIEKMKSYLLDGVEDSEAFFAKEEIKILAHKLDSIFTDVFNNREVYYKAKDEVKKNLEFDWNRFALTSAETKGGLFVDFMSANGYVIESFRNLITIKASITKVAGDGNCFFRAVVRSCAPYVTSEWEDKLSLRIRKKLNIGVEKNLDKLGQGKIYPFKGFVVQNVNDSVTMAKAGVWADHIQVKKLASRLQRPIWIIAFDDGNLTRDIHGVITPGKDFIIGEEYAKESKMDPLLLYYTPSPGHYESFSQPVLVMPTPSLTLTEELQAMEKVKVIEARNVTELFFKIEAEISQIEEIYSKQRSFNVANLVDKNLQSAIQNELLSRSSIIFNLIKRFLHLILLRIGKGYLKSIHMHKDYFLHEELITALVDDDLLFIDGALEQIGDGPLSDLVDRLRKVAPSVVKQNESDDGRNLGDSKLSRVDMSVVARNVNTSALAPNWHESTLRNDSSADLWFTFLKHVQTTSVSFNGRETLIVSATSLANFKTALSTLDYKEGIRIDRVEFIGCCFDTKCCKLLVSETGMDKWPDFLPFVTLTNCNFAEKAVVEAGQKIKLIN
eukprot:TRINITY_DN13931_c0_g1_i1.p1 TRINITY_DN13931_c0_g1~~TRINITY_DN13931_c0_g1_i1.p1  ORF type:complete len:739 (+),score=124.96 TRINITY_DN13931_c0_g1_i1:65-2281(+)